MAAFLIIVSFILHLIAFLAIILLFLRQNKLLQVEKEQKKVIEELEQVIDAYMLEMKEENERFIQRVKKIQEEQVSMKHVPSTKTVTVDESRKTGEKGIKLAPVEEKNEGRSLDFTPNLKKAASLQAVKAYRQQTGKQQEEAKSAEATEEEKKSVSEMKQAFAQVEKTKTKAPERLIHDSMLTQLLIMKKEGMTVEEMAKKLKRGKTEIELLLKFHEKQKE